MQIQQLAALIEYEPKTGLMRWKERGEWVVIAGLQTELARQKFNAKYAGQPCLTTLDKDGYLAGHVLDRFYRAHRLAYAIHHGRWPKHTVDHKNRDRTDNRIENLIDATRAQQQSNRGKQKNNTSGWAGVHREGKTGKWVARATVSGKRVFLGKFDTKIEAVAAKRNFFA